VRLQGKVIVVTGSTRGIGRAIAEACAREGARVVISSRREQAVAETSAWFQAQGLQATGLTVDVSTPDAAERLLEHALASWGQVDVWVNNAGLSSGYRPLDEIPGGELAEIIATNLTGTMYACRVIIPYFRERGGILLNMAGKGYKGDASPFTAPYAATKAAVTSLTRSLAQENKGYPISIHAVVPGMVATDFYRDIKTSPKVAAQVASIPYVLSAFGVPLDAVSRTFVDLAAQRPGESTGRIYSLLGGRRLLRGIVLAMWYRATGKMQSSA